MGEAPAQDPPGQSGWVLCPGCQQRSGPPGALCPDCGSRLPEPERAGSGCAVALIGALVVSPVPSHLLIHDHLNGCR
ncbi:MAG: hypothetical protein U0R52_11790 [Solirubrobacterales bacterium]